MGVVVESFFSEEKECLSCEVSEGDILGKRFVGFLLRMIAGRTLKKFLIILL
jgi:hypothetical protein